MDNTKTCPDCGEPCRWLKDMTRSPKPGQDFAWALVDARTTAPADQTFNRGGGHILHRNTCKAGQRKQPNRKPRG